MNIVHGTMFHGMSRLRGMTEAQHHTFMFADICGYSLLTAVDGDAAAADVAIHFLSEASSLAREHGAEVVKGLGDAVMVYADDAAEAIRMGLELVSAFGEDPDLPSIHVGVHTGPALNRAGDWWGATVNLAARVAGTAEANQLLVTEATKQAAGDMASARLHGLGARCFKNIPLPIQVYAASGVLAAAPF
jgi:adenylate cyclase